jgi:hypothetical protein
MKCENCRFVLETKPGNHICRRNPPVPVNFVDAYENDPNTGARMVFCNSSFPAVNHDWYCGEWKPKTSDLQ